MGTACCTCPQGAQKEPSGGLSIFNRFFLPFSFPERIQVCAQIERERERRRYRDKERQKVGRERQEELGWGESNLCGTHSSSQAQLTWMTWFELGFCKQDKTHPGKDRDRYVVCAGAARNNQPEIVSTTQTFYSLPGELP